MNDEFLAVRLVRLGLFFSLLISNLDAFGQRVDVWESRVGLGFYLPKYTFINENGLKEGLTNADAENQTGFVLEVAAVRKLRHRLDFSAGLRYWVVPTGGRFYLNRTTLTQGFLPSDWHFVGIPLDLRFRVSSFFSLDLGWQSGCMLNFGKISPLVRQFFNSADFAGNAGCRYDFGRVHLLLRYSQNFGSFSHLYSGSSPITKSELRHRQFQIMLGLKIFERG